MSMPGRVLVVALLVATVYSQPTYIPYDPQMATTEPELSCSCLPCSGNPDSFTKHMQREFCESAAVIQGRVTNKVSHSAPAGMWNSDLHKETFKNPYGFPATHYELSVRVLAVYSNLGETKISIGDKIIVRYARQSSCPACETLVENFEDEAYTDRGLHRSDKYIFFLPTVTAGFGEKLEAVMSQCTRVWRYSKRGNMVLGHIPLVQRYILSTTECGKCRVSGCYQNKCVKASEVEECDHKIWSGEWRDNACQPILDHGICYYNPKTESCRWTSISEGGYRSKQPIEQCLIEE